MERERENSQVEEESGVGVLIPYDCNDELAFKLKYIAEYQKKHDINVKYYYTANEMELIPYYRLLADIFEEDINTLIAVGRLYETGLSDETIEKVFQCVDVREI